MAIKSKYDNKCKDCGTAYSVGDQIDTNGNESPNKTGEIKAHWCKYGKACGGMMKTTSAGIDFSKMPATKPEASKDPTPEQFLELGVSMLSSAMSSDEKKEWIKRLTDSTDHKIADALIERSRIEKAMNDLGMQHPGRRGFVEDVLR